jgi:hypothetical protein
MTTTSPSSDPRPWSGLKLVAHQFQRLFPRPVSPVFAGHTSSTIHPALPEGRSARRLVRRAFGPLHDFEGSRVHLSNTARMEQPEIPVNRFAVRLTRVESQHSTPAGRRTRIFVCPGWRHTSPPDYVGSDLRRDLLGRTGSRSEFPSRQHTLGELSLVKVCQHYSARSEVERVCALISS